MSSTENLAIPRTSVTHPINISWVIPQEFLTCLAEDFISGLSGGKDLLDFVRSDKVYQQRSKHGAQNGNKYVSHPHFVDGVNSLQMDSKQQLSQQQGNAGPSDAIEIGKEEEEIEENGLGGTQKVLVSSEAASNPNKSVMGNVCLSSCPGKKVRLDTGPVNGRAMICRDVREDFRRLKEVGVGCVINCLFDPELEFLGSPWPEYHAAAQACDIQVFRIPMIEGAAPQSMADLHKIVLAMDERINAHTNILAHCRGGIGRAGLVIACYLLYKGLVSSPERAIQLLRIRRSPKAIETREQEIFIENYYVFLKAEGVFGKILA